MLNILSLLVGVVALFLGIFAFFPFLGLALGQLSSSRSGRNLNLVVIVIGIVRLFLGGGII